MRLFTGGGSHRAYVRSIHPRETQVRQKRQSAHALNRIKGRRAYCALLA